MSGGGGNIIVEQMRGKLTVKRVLRVDDHIRLREQILSNFPPRAGNESPAKQTSYGSIRTGTKDSQTGERSPFAQRRKEVPPRGKVGFKIVCRNVLFILIFLSHGGSLFSLKVLGKSNPSQFQA
jgi:hypothetical protein